MSSSTGPFGANGRFVIDIRGPRTLVSCMRMPEACGYVKWQVGTMTQTTLDIELITTAVELACRAPSLHNSQPWRLSLIHI